MNAPTKVKPINDLRSYIAALEANGVLKRVKAEVDWKYELCHVSKVNEEQKGPALLYENVKGYDIPVFTSAFTTPQRIAICLEQDPSLSMCQLSRKWMELTTKKMVKPVFVDKPPVMENVITGDDIDINMFPSPWFYPDDGGRFFGTSAFMVTQDPDTGWTNLGTYRAQVLGKDILGSQIIKGKHGDMHMKKYKERGELMPAAYVVGCDPVLFLTSSTLVSAQTDEYDVAGSLRGRPVEVFKSDLTGLTYPANAEIIAEGFVDPNELMEEGPFGEYTGYYSGNKGKDYPKPVLRIKRILHRNKPIMWSTTVGKPINDIHMIQSLNRTATLWHDLETMKVPGIQSVYFPAAATGRFWVIVSVRQMYPGHSNHVADAVLGSTTGHYGVKGVIVVDHDIAADDMDRVWWAMATRFDPKRSAQITQRGRSTPLDPGLPIEARDVTSRIVLDCCTPYEWENKPNEIFMDRSVLKKVSDRWNEYGFTGASPVAEMIDRLTRPEVIKGKGGK
ncbi:3-polyprenyl-4-hydroxybenzoate carboxy-lyase [Georgfuchsia toluolica]|uniref:3-polyprenyl-4-hydroxybenzoate carboxy-lyase n=1 Tax=Georgfuchsia toluolica TaxID=424218 RepID=A0A916J4W7_9PROT|nr:phenylphosphate carboxylase subunit beta [Georgfuchsia toluolica]CAG4883260.1 3-polyprenyl-4-hydroxybenzoate carboxy-lyase [Georgfuchsia toluolica]